MAKKIHKRFQLLHYKKKVCLRFWNRRSKVAWALVRKGKFVKIQFLINYTFLRFTWVNFNVLTFFHYFFPLFTTHLTRNCFHEAVANSIWRFLARRNRTKFWWLFQYAIVVICSVHVMRRRSIFMMNLPTAASGSPGTTTNVQFLINIINIH